MPSGGITITPGYQLGPGEPVNNSKLNQGFQPIGQVNEGAITDRELSDPINQVLTNVRGTNLLCNGGFALWNDAETTALYHLVPGVFGTAKHDITGTSPARWFVPNDTNRDCTRQAFALGQTDVPDALPYFMRYVQSAPVDPTINPAYIGQRLEDVNRFSDRTVTFTIWARATAAITVIPGMRQFFGTSGSPSVTVDGPPVTLAANTWTEVKATFEVPTVAGKTITNVYVSISNIFPSCTEFRLIVPQGIAFTIDVSHAMLVLGDSALGWDDRLPFEDFLFNCRYWQTLGFPLTTSVATYVPMVNFRVPMVANRANDARLVLFFSSGTGGTIGGHPIYANAIAQANVHSVPTSAYAIIDSELRAPP